MERLIHGSISVLSWSHFTELLPLQQPLQREYYAEMCRIERWSVRTLRERIGSMLYERTALSRKREELIERELRSLRDTERVTADLLMRDPYMLDFLGLHDSYSENDLEAAILREMEGFILELGAGFSFVARQKRIQLDGDDFYLDLLSYNRKLKRMVALELKVGAFKKAANIVSRLPLPPNGEILFYPTDDGGTRVKCRFQEETIWLSQAPCHALSGLCSS
jgi:predicted nuclease of restriction endonuclease-like (RecB) superfamily